MRSYLFQAGDGVEEPPAVATDGGRKRVVDRLNNSRLIGLSIALFPAYFVVDAWIIQPGGISNLTLNNINALFICVLSCCGFARWR